jgi:hypothetical protein
VSVDTTLVGKEVLIDGESSGDSTVLEDVGLDVLGSADAVGGGRVLLFARVIKSGVGLAAG